MAFWNYGLFKSRKSVRRARSRRSVLALQLERLEDRTMPSADLLSPAFEPIRVVDPEVAVASQPEPGPVDVQADPVLVGAAPPVILPDGAIPITWQGVEAYAMEGQWIVQLDGVEGTPAEQSAEVGNLLIGVAGVPALTPLNYLGSDGTFLIQAPPDVGFTELEAALAAIPGFQYVEPNFIAWLAATPNEDAFFGLWGLHNTGQTGGTVDADIDAPAAWNISTGSNTVVVGVIDGGVDYTHPDLAANMWVNHGEIADNGVDDDLNGYVDDVYGYDFINGEGDPLALDGDNHGTHVAGIIGAVGDNVEGVVGVNWDVQIMALQIFDAAGTNTNAATIEAINYATMMRLDGVNLLVTNNSYGGLVFSQAMMDAIAGNRDAGILFVAAAGNGGSDGIGDDNDLTPFYPASYDLDNIISVAATDRNDNLADFSNYGATSVDLAAPGVEILSTIPGNAYEYSQGTSQATPYVAGVAALAWSVAPDATYQEIRDAILAGADPVAALDGITVTGARLNALNTLLIISGISPVPVTVFAADFSDGGGAANLDGFTVDNTEATEPGLWHLSTGRGSDDGHSSDDSMYFGTGEGSAGGGNYNVGDTAGRITSPVIDLTGAVSAQLSFAYFLETEGAIGFDVATLLVSTNEVDYTEIDSNNGAGPTSGWETAVLDLTDYVGSSIQIRFDFATVDASFNNFEGWYVDDVTISAIFLQRTLTWDGDGADDNWTTAENWAGDVAPVAGDAVVFADGAARLTNTNDFAAGTNFASITFAGGGYSISGNAVTLSAGVINTVGTNVVNLPITLDGAQTFSAVASTTLQVDGTVDNAGHLLTVESAGTVKLSDVVSGAGGLTKIGAGTLVLAGANTYSGPTILDAGTLAVGSNTAVGSGTLTLNGGTLRANGAARTLTNAVTVGGNVTIGGTLDLTLSGATTLTGNRTLTVANTALTTLSGVIGQSGGTWRLTKAGAGTLVLTGNNTYAGGTTLNAGTLAVGHNGAVGTGRLTLNTGTVTASGAARTLTNLVTLGGNVTIGGALNLTLSGATSLTGNRTLTVANTGVTTLSGVISQNGGTWSLTKAGAGTLVLSGNNTYAGGTILSAGVLAVGNNGAAGTGTLTLNAGTLRANAAARTLTNAVTLGGNVTIGGTLNLTLSGAATLTGNRTLTVANTGLTTLSGVVGESGGTWRLTKAGVGTLVLSGNNTYAGGTTLSAGTLGIGNNGAVGTGTLTLNGGTLTARVAARTLTNVLILGGNFTIGGTFDLTLSGAATLTGSRTLTVANTGLTTLSGVISQTSAGFGITKAGTGKLVLSGANTYSGNTTITNGTLIVNGTQTSSNVTVKTGATLGGAGSVKNVTVQAGGTLSPGSSPAILQTRAFALNSDSTFVAELNGTTAGTGYDRVSVTGTVNLGSSALSVALGFTPIVGDTFTIITNDGIDAVTGTFSGLAEGATISQGGVVLQISYIGGTGNDVVLTRIP